MRIEVLTQLLQKEHGSKAFARIPQKVTIDGYNRKSKVEVYYGSGKVYSYTGSILAVAERLDLIPTIDHHSEAQRIVSELLDVGISFGSGSVIDTINHVYWKDATKIVRCKENHLDEYDRWISKFEIVDNPF